MATWVRLFTFSVDPPTLLHSFFTQNFQRPGLLWLGVNETGLMPLGEPMPKFFSGSDLVFLCRGWGCYLPDSFISIIHSISLLHICLNDLISWPLFFYDEKQFYNMCTLKNEHVPPNGNTRGYMYPQTKI